MSQLLDARKKFTKMLAQLFIYAYKHGHEVTISFALRCRDCPQGKKNSLHKDGLAADLNLFKDGKWLTNTNDHEELGKYWERLGGAWGGRFGDGNHYSLPIDERK